MAAHQLQPLDHDTDHDRDGGRDPGQRATGRRTAAVLVAVAVLGTGWVVSRPGNDDPGRVRPAPASTPRPDDSPDSPDSPGSPGAEAVTYRDVAGLRLPVSTVAGPHETAGGRASGFARTDRGAAFAAVHLLVRTFPFVGSAVFGPTITEQVLGPDAAALARLTAQAYEPAARAAKIHDGQPLGSEGGWVAGNRLDPTGPPDHRSPAQTRTVAVLLRQSDGADGAGFVEYRVRLVWRDGDWRLIAPAWGDWRTAARATTGAARASYLTYDTPATGIDTDAHNGAEPGPADGAGLDGTGLDGTGLDGDGPA